MGGSYFGGAGFPTWSLCFRAGACWNVEGGRAGPSQPTRGTKLSYTKSLSSTSTPAPCSPPLGPCLLGGKKEPAGGDAPVSVRFAGGCENATRPHIQAAVLLAARIFLVSTPPRFLAHRPTLFSLGAARLPCSRHKQIPKVSSTNPPLSESDRGGWCLIPLVFWGVAILAGSNFPG